MIFRMKLEIVLKKNLIASSSIIEKYLKTKTKSFDAEATDSHDKEMAKEAFNYVCFVVILIDFVF